MPVSPLTGKPAPKELLIDPSRLEREYYERRPDLGNRNQLVSFGTSGHRGSPLNGSFTESHILAIGQAICDYRRSRSYDGPLFMGKDTHAVSGPAERTALEVLAANGVETVILANGWFAARPSGTENIYKLYAESFQSETHLNAIVADAREILHKALRKAQGK